MKPIEPYQLSSGARQAFKLIEFDADEKLLFEVRKHWFGLFLIYFTGTLLAAAPLGVAMGAALVDAESMANTGVSLSTLRLPLVLACLLATVLVVGGTAIGAFLYKSNVILITSEKLAQLLNVTLFERRVSQLSIGDVQDVSVHQDGVLAHFFKYGTIVIETAGEQQNYTFTFASYPYETAKMIVSAHEENLKLYGN